MQTAPFPDTVGAAGNPKLVMSGWGSGTGIFQGEDAQEVLKTETLCFEFVLPECYVAGQSVILSITARINDAGGNSHTFDSLDVEAYEIAEAGTAESDICATDAQTLAEIMTAYSFTITSTNLGPGDLVRIFIRTSIQGSFGGSFKAEIGGATMKLDIKG